MHYLPSAISDASAILHIVRSHSPHNVAYMTGWVLLVRTIGTDSRFRIHQLNPGDQLPETTEKILDDGHSLNSG